MDDSIAAEALGSDLGDRRLDARYRLLLERLGAQPQLSIPAACRGKVRHAVLIGRDPGPIARGKPIDDLVLPQVPAGLPSSLLERRPDIASAERSVMAHLIDLESKGRAARAGDTWQLTA
mgnify:CR=1 FL=1